MKFAPLILSAILASVAVPGTGSSQPVPPGKQITPETAKKATRVQESDTATRKAIAMLDDLAAPVEGSQMTRAIHDGTKDPGSHIVADFQVFSTWVSGNRNKMSDEAKAVFSTFETYVARVKVSGQTSMDGPSYSTMIAEMTGLYDISALNAVAALDRLPAPTTASQMTNAIHRGTADPDNHTLDAEFRVFSRWVSRNGNRLSVKATAVFRIYERYVNEAHARGQTGMDQQSYDSMIAEMRAVRD